jgi:Domain of unknown function (DUF4082)
MKFRSDVNGQITGLRFYKSANNTGTHTGHLWASAGALLGSLTFANESASGWQQASFAAPVTITAGTTYVASYHTSAGHYSVSSFTFSGLANGTYTLTPSKSGFTFTPASQSVTVSGASVTGVNFTASAAAAPPLSIDATVFTDQGISATSVTSPTFSTTAGNELLLAFIAADYLAGANTIVTGVTGAGLTWQLVARTNVQSGTSEIWRAFASAPLANASVTATVSQPAVSSLTVVSLEGVDSSGVNGSGAIGATGSANAASGAPTATLTTTRNNSWVFGVGNDYDTAIARTVGANQTMVHQDLAPTGDTYWVQRTTSTTPLSGSVVSLNDTAPTGDRYNFAICEILPPLQ